MRVKRYIEAGLLLALAAGLAAPAEARWQPQSTLGRAPAPITLRFAPSEGWSEPEVGQGHTAHETLVRFSRAPEDAPARLDAQLAGRGRVGVDWVTWTQEDDGLLLSMRTRRPSARVQVERARRGGVHSVTLELGAFPVIPAASYEAMTPPGSGALAALQRSREALAAGATDACDALLPLAKREEPWAAWMRLQHADCLRQAGHRNQAILALRALATSPSTPAPVVALASLRLEEWPETHNPHKRLPWPKRRDVLALPEPLVEELSLRAARHLLYRGRVADSAAFLERAARRGRYSAERREVADLMRLELMALFSERGDGAAALRVANLAPIPPRSAPAWPGMTRLRALALARANQLDAALEAASPLLEVAGARDPELVIATHALLLRHGQRERAADVVAGLPRDYRWVEALVDAGVIGAELAEELARWLEHEQRTTGGPSLARALGPLDVAEPTGALAEGRQWALLAALACDGVGSAPPATASPEWPLFAAMCHLGSGASVEAADVWASARRDHGLGASLLGDTVERFTRATLEFQERFGP